ncbi:hypothetical protein SO802_023150 [Lithocarpus litseifolius]|uniref:Uncharacterized protein n=1 Tax=Lithocarpus litseifolius TaxID=425828 RepID=A0AAW2C5U6_9ROSI
MEEVEDSSSMDPSTLKQSLVRKQKILPQSILSKEVEASSLASPAVGALIDPPYLPWLVYVYGPDGLAQERPVGRKTNVTSYHFPDGIRAPNTCSYNHSFKIQPIVQEHKELIWLAGNLKLELTEYSLPLYSGEDAGGDDDDDSGKGSESRLQAISRGRGASDNPADK